MRLTDIDGHGHAGFRQCQGLLLRFPQHRPGIGSLATRTKAGELHEEKREVSLTPGASPLLNHGGENLAVLVTKIRVRFTLIPNGSRDRIRREGRHHAVPQPGFAPGMAAGILGRVGKGERDFTVGLGLFRRLLPFPQFLFVTFERVRGIRQFSAARNPPATFKSGSASKASSLVQASASVPPQEESIIPTGNFMVRCKSRPKK